MPTDTSLTQSPPLTSPATIPVREIPDLAHLRPRSRRKKHLLLILAICAAWVLAEAAASWLVQHTRLRNTLSSRLQTAFGRPVDVRRFSVNLRGIPALQADSVTVAEDPRFGNEYFLYADTLTFRPRWLPLLIGRLEIGTIEISNPSLNLVRAKDGRWNIEEWLPAPPELFSEPAAKPTSTNLPGPVQQKPAAPSASTPNIRSISVSGGRINFKRATEKSAFSLIDVEGSLERQNAGRWSINLGASPARAAVVLQQAGTIHVQGEVGGTGSRLRPAKVQLTWQDAAVADALRLASAYDHGVRGTFSAALSAHTVGAVWNLSGRAEVRRLHRWDLAMRADNPGLNFEVAGDWFPEDSAVNISSATIETPRSKITGTGAFSWDPNTNLAAENLPENFSITSTAIDGDDLLAWIRAFVPNISNDIALKGDILGHVVFAGTPPAPVSGSIDAANLSLEGGSLRSPISTRDARIAFTPQTAHLLPSFIAIGASGGSLRAEASCASAGPVCEAKLTGRAADVADLTSASSAVGFNLPIGWHIDGPATFDLHWLFLGRPIALPSMSPQIAVQPETSGPTGKITFQELSLRAPFLNQPISGIKGRIDLTASDATLALSSADAFGGTWSGTLDLLPHGGERHFALSVDRLNSEDLDRWLNPRWRQGFLQNVLPFLASSRRAGLPSSAQAHGRLAIDEFAFTRYTLKHLQGELLLDGSKLEFENAEGNFYGSKISGELHVNLSASPTYKINARYAGLDLALLTSGSALFSSTFSGIASGNLVLNLAGIGRQDLAASLHCEGAAEIQNAGWKGIDLLASLRAEETRPGSSSAVDVAANYTCANHRIEISDLRIAAPGETLLASGSVDPAHSLDFHITRLTRAAASARDDDPLDSPHAARYLLRGPLLHPVTTAAQPSRPEPTPQR